MSARYNLMEKHYNEGNYDEAQRLIEKSLVENRRNGLVARSSTQKSKVNVQYAKIHILESRIKFAHDKIDEAKEALIIAKDKLTSSASDELEQFGIIY